MMRCLIVDDEKPAREVMQQMLSCYPGVAVVGEAADVARALELTAQHRPDIVFLDIQLRGETGFDYVTGMRECPPYVVFVTAYDEFAIRGFECNALDYLLKPVSVERLAETFRRLQERRPGPAPTHDLVFLKGASTGRFVSWSEISHILSDGNYSRVSLDEGTELVVLRPLKDWLTMAPEGFFLQIHRSTLVHRGAIRELRSSVLGRREILLRSGLALPVGRAYWSGLKSLM